LLSQTQEVVVQTRLGVVVVAQFRDVEYSLLGLLEDGNADCYIVRGFQILAVLVTQVLLANIAEELSVKGPQMARDKGILPVAVLLHDALGDEPGEAHISIDGEEVAVDKPGSTSLEHSVEESEDLPANEFIIPVHNHEDILWLAVGIGSHSQIVHGSSLLSISDVQVFGGIQFGLGGE
jgi:hypothetical protein